MTDYIINGEVMGAWESDVSQRAFDIAWQREQINKIKSHPLSEHDREVQQAERVVARMELLKDLQTFIDNADSRIGCPNGTLGIAYLIQWMGGQGYDCD